MKTKEMIIALGNKIVLFIGKLVDKLDKCRAIYLTHKNTNSVNNKGGVISSDVIVQFPHNISIGKGTYIIGGFLIASDNSKIIIGDNCLISYNVHIRTSTHYYFDRKHTINTQGERSSDIIIKDDCWLGFGCQIMPGVTIAEGCVIGAGAVVTKDTEPYGVYVGVPARMIKHRD